jgi:hypothetical protein
MDIDHLITSNKLGDKFETVSKYLTVVPALDKIVHFTDTTFPNIDTLFFMYPANLSSDFFKRELFLHIRLN